MSNQESVELSLQERMQLNLRKSAVYFRYSLSAVATSITFLALGLLAGFESLGDLKNAVYLALIPLVAFIVWSSVRGRLTKKELQRISSDYTNQAYFFVLSTSTHGKHEDISMDFFHIAEEIFPELKREEIISLEKTGEEYEVEDVTVYDDKDKKKPKREWRFNVVAKTKEGYFVIRHFKKENVTYDQIQDTIGVANAEFKTWTKGVFRLVCLAKSYDKEVLDDYEKLNKKEIPVDLILVRDKGFTFAKIGIEKF